MRDRVSEIQSRLFHLDYVMEHGSSDTLHAALGSDVAYLLAQLAARDEALAKVEKVRQELFDISNDDGWTTQTRAAYRDSSRAIYTALTGESE